MRLHVHLTADKKVLEESLERWSGVANTPRFREIHGRTAVLGAQVFGLRGSELRPLFERTDPHFINLLRFGMAITNSIPVPLPHRFYDV